MNNIIRMIEAAIGNTLEPVSLLIEATGHDSFSAALVNVPSNETITMQTDWQIDLAAEGLTVERAIMALDELCAEDFK